MQPEVLAHSTGLPFDPMGVTVAFTNHQLGDAGTFQANDAGVTAVPM